MSSPRRRGLPKKKPITSQQQDIEDDLPVLEAADDLEELPLLEPMDDAAAPANAEPVGPVRVTLEAASEPGIDQVLAVEVAAMDKKDVPAAVQGPLAAAVAKHAPALRFRRVLVRFLGEAMIGSAMKEQVATQLRDAKPHRVVLRRGFGDETVLELPVPTLPMDLQADGETTKVSLITTGLEPADLAALLPARLQELAATAKGRRFTLLCQGGAKLDAALRDLAATTLAAAGANRVAAGERVLFDRELRDRVQWQERGGELVVTIDPASDELVTQEALQQRLPELAASIAGRIVRLEAKAPLGAAERQLCLQLLTPAAPQHLSLQHGTAAPEVLWPPVLQCERGAEVRLLVQPHGRERAAVLAAIAAELPAHSAMLAGATVVVDWPAGFALDAEVDALLAKVFAGAARGACTVAGDLREPFHPLPLRASGDATQRRIELDTDAGKPPELVRAVERRLPAIAATLRGSAVRLVLQGAAAPSRTLLRTLVAAIETAGCTRLEVEARGADGKPSLDVLLPPLLTISQDQSGVRLAAVAGGRDAAQIGLALARELDAAALAKGCHCTVSTSSATAALVAALVARGAGKVLVDGPSLLQVHPPLFAAAERKGAQWSVRATPGAEEAMLTRQLEAELPALLAKAGRLQGAEAVVVWPGAGDPPAGAVADLVAKLVAQGVASVELDAGDGRPFQVHPPVPELELVEEVEAAPAATVAAAAPVAAAPVAAAASAAAVPVGDALLRVLLRRDESVPALLVLGVEAGADAGGVDANHAAAAMAQLQQHLPRFRGRAVLLVLQHQGQDVPLRRAQPFATQLAQAVATTAAATLVFRGPDAAGRSHFQVLQSTLRALPVGAAFGDPRAKG